MPPIPGNCSEPSRLILSIDSPARTIYLFLGGVAMARRYFVALGGPRSRDIRLGRTAFYSTELRGRQPMLSKTRLGLSKTIMPT